MCLYVDVDAEEQFRKRHKNKKEIIVWKVVNKKIIYEYSEYTSLYRFTLIVGGWLKAKGKLKCKDIVNGGAIHVYINRKYARGCRDPWSDEKIIKCKALMKDLIAVGNNRDVCFTKIWIPKSELK